MEKYGIRKLMYEGVSSFSFSNGLKIKSAVTHSYYFEFLVKNKLTFYSKYTKIKDRKNKKYQYLFDIQEPYYSKNSLYEMFNYD